MKLKMDEVWIKDFMTLTPEQFIYRYGILRSVITSLYVLRWTVNYDKTKDVDL